MAGKLRWGIIGAGHIGRKFAIGIQASEFGRLVAVGSRTLEKAETLGKEFSAPHCYASYQAVADDPEVDAVYIGLPHPMHKDAALLGLRAGKAVLCEKPFTVNTKEARAVISLARRKKLFLMEAVWSRFLPTLTKVRQIVASGVIGEVRMVIADFSFRGAWNPEGRLLNPHLAGGGLLDVGIYPLSLSGMILGQPLEVVSLSHIGETGVDEQAGIILKYDAGRLAVLACGVRTQSPMEARILGTEGSIHLHSVWWKGERLTLTVAGKPPEEMSLPMVGNGYNYEADEVARCIQAGETESDVMPLDETLSQMRTMDRIRAKWGLRYPMEK
jgi:predicted dehydrogenase